MRIVAVRRVVCVQGRASELFLVEAEAGRFQPLRAARALL
jgi:hypothetical protein